MDDHLFHSRLLRLSESLDLQFVEQIRVSEACEYPARSQLHGMAVEMLFIFKWHSEHLAEISVMRVGFGNNDVPTISK